MKELFVLGSKYAPSTAATNHAIAYIKGLAENGIRVTLFFLLPSKDRDKFDGEIENVDFVYLWDALTSRNKIWNYFLAIKKFYAAMTPEIPVLVLGCPDEIVLLRLKRKIRIFQERTENPNTIKVFFNFLYKRIIPRLDGLVVITPSLRNLFIEDYNVDPNKIIVANMVVDEKRFLSLEIPITPHTISYCGTISERKDGVSYLVKAFSRVHEKYPEFRLVLMGDFENENTKDLILSLVKEKKLQESIIFTGVVNNEEMPIRLKSSEILALSRPMQKEKAFGFATKIGEYLMTERPVVMTDVGDASFYLKDKENVVFAKPNDEYDFAEKLIWVIEHPQEATEIGKNGKKQALKEFNYLTESKKIIELVFH